MTNIRYGTDGGKWQKEQYCGRPETAKASVCGSDMKERKNLSLIHCQNIQIILLCYKTQISKF